VQIETAYGPAEVALDGPARARFLLVLTHGAGGGVDSADLLAARDAGLSAGGAVARVLQPYRVRGARAPGSPQRQDEAWLEIIAALRRRRKRVPLVQGGRSNGARVACRTASAAGATAVLALAFPLHPPGRPDKSRDSELRGAGTHVLVINGDRDPFGVPEPDEMTEVVILTGETHTLSKRSAEVGLAAADWLSALLPVGGGTPHSVA
jgi:predicted alpha/beta-hydrolase family hydrolase